MINRSKRNTSSVTLILLITSLLSTFFPYYVSSFDDETITKCDKNTCDSLAHDYDTSEDEEDYYYDQREKHFDSDGKWEIQAQDLLFQEIEYIQYKSGKPFGRYLDAGTGAQSFSFLQTLLKYPKAGVSPNDWVAVTASLDMKQKVDSMMDTNINTTQGEEEVEEIMTASKSSECKGGIIIGNWDHKNPENELCKGELFDTILMDYLIGAMDAYSPYFQYQIIDRLKQVLNPNGGRIYIVGMQPIQDILSDEHEILSRMKSLRDGCIFLAGERYYREYPKEWVIQLLQKTPGFTILADEEFVIGNQFSDVQRQLQVARSKFKFFPNQKLADEMENILAEFEKEIERYFEEAPDNIIYSGFDYLVAAEYNLNT